MPLNAASPESESKKFAFAGFNNVAFGRIHDQFQTVLQVSADTVEYAFTGTLTLHQYRKVIRIPCKLMPTLFQFFVSWVEHDVRQ